MQVQRNSEKGAEKGAEKRYITAKRVEDAFN